MKDKQIPGFSEEFLKTSFRTLSEAEQNLLFKAPALVSLLAASTNNGINEAQKAEALKLAHLKTFTARTELIFFYKTVELNFIEDFESLEKKFYPFDKPKIEALRNEIEKVNVIINKLDKKVADLLHWSFNGYANHIKKSGIGILDDFIFPIPIKGINY
jgi:hypothetical protein